MKKFLIKIGVLAGILIVLSVLEIFVIGDQYSTEYTASIADKMTRLKSTNGPKIVLIGDSNVAFGIRSERLEEAFEMPVVNMGLHAALGVSYLSEMAKIHLEPGDLIVLCNAEYRGNGAAEDPELAWVATGHSGDLWRFVGKVNYIPMLKAYPRHLSKSLFRFVTGTGNRKVTGPYSRDSFNEYGDNVYFSTHEAYYTFTEEGEVPEVEDACAAGINALNRYVKDHGATLLVAGYPIADGPYTPDKRLFEEYEKELRGKMDCPVISSLNDYFFDYSYFSDTVLHMTDAGAVLRTDQLIRDLQDYMGRE